MQRDSQGRRPPYGLQGGGGVSFLPDVSARLRAERTVADDRRLCDSVAPVCRRG